MAHALIKTAVGAALMVPMLASAELAVLIEGYTAPATLSFLNGNSTLVLEDDFDGTAFDAASWDARTEDPEATVTVANGVISINDPADPEDQRQGALQMFSAHRFTAPSYSIALDVTAVTGGGSVSLGAEAKGEEGENSHASLEAGVQFNADGEISIQITQRAGVDGTLTIDRSVRFPADGEQILLCGPFTVALVYDGVTQIASAVVTTDSNQYIVSLDEVPAYDEFFPRVDAGSGDQGGTVEITRFHYSCRLHTKRRPPR